MYFYCWNFGAWYCKDVWIHSHRKSVEDINWWQVNDRPLALSPLRHWANDDVLAASDGPARHPAVGETLRKALSDGHLLMPNMLWEWLCSFMDWTTLKTSGAASLHVRKLLKGVSWAARPLTFSTELMEHFQLLSKVLSCVRSWGTRRLSGDDLADDVAL
jgi:hypothetical protein